MPCWLGLTPKNNSSGESIKHGGITKTGNKYLRCTFTECLGGIPFWKKPEKSKINDLSNCGLAVNTQALNANIRIYNKYQHLHNNKKNIQIVQNLQLQQNLVNEFT